MHRNVLILHFSAREKLKISRIPILRYVFSVIFDFYYFLIKKSVKEQKTVTDPLNKKTIMRVQIPFLTGDPKQIIPSPSLLFAKQNSLSDAAGSTFHRLRSMSCSNLRYHTSQSRHHFSSLDFDVLHSL
jgi:hypothetical protein